MNLEHKKRWIAAVVGLIFLFGTYYFFRHWGLVFLTVLISSTAYFEFLKFSGAGKSLTWLSAAVGVVLSAWLCLDFAGPLVALYLATGAVLVRGLIQTHVSPPEQLANNFLHAQARVFALIYLIFFLSFVPKIHALPHGPWWLLFLLLIIWLGDTAAYYGGKSLGRHKLSVNVSPGKTLEGALTALVGVVVLALVFQRTALPHMMAWKMVLIALLSSVVAQAGDLLESLMKRAYQVKDSGSILPGHGGVFDRFDSLILAAPFYYFLLWVTT